MYSPKIKEELVRAMYQIKQKTGKPITKQANEAMREYLQRFKDILNEDEQDAK
jgi:uncharacterized protein YneF (UPF0154 family)